MAYSRDTAGNSERTRFPVTTSRGMEDRDRGRAVLKMPKAEQGAFFNDRKDENGKVNDRGLIGIRGQKAAEGHLETMRRPQEARTQLKPTSVP